jgi:uncharacterized protein with PQ loop repeat
MAAVLGPICTILSVSLIWPQVLRVYRLKTVDGISPFGTLHGVAGCTLWTSYGIAQGVGPLIVSNGVIGLALVSIGVAQIRHRTLLASTLAGAIVAFVAIAAGSLMISSTLTGWLAIVVGMTSIIPQTRYVVTATSLAGVSLPMYALVVSSSVMWVAYGLVIGDPLVLMPHTVVLPCGVYIAYKVWRSQRVNRALVAEAA